jgi:hypothetical protein
VKDLGADVNQQDEIGMTGMTALSVASAGGLHDTVRYLVEELGADVNADVPRPPLYVAAVRGHLDVVRLLLKLGANIDQTDSNGVTPLMVATVQKHDELVLWLVKAGANTQKRRFHADGVSTALSLSQYFAGASAEQTMYLESKTHCSSPGCSGAGLMKCTGCKQVRYCKEACQLAHWKAHKADCKRWSAELAKGKGKGGQ